MQGLKSVATTMGFSALDGLKRAAIFELPEAR